MVPTRLPSSSPVLLAASSRRPRSSFSRWLLALGSLLAWLPILACGPAANERPAADGVADGMALDGRSAADRGPVTARVAYAADFQTVNEYISSSVPIHTMLHYYALFVPLAEEQADFSQGPPSFEPRLAESWQASDDGLALTFALRTDAEWSDGTPITAEDVRFSWQAAVHPEVGWVYAEIKKNIRDVEVVDPHTVRFHFSEPTPTALYEAVQGVIVPHHAWSELPFEQWRDRADWFAENLVVSGPFDLESHEPGQRFVLARNQAHYDESQPVVDRVVYEIVPDAANQLALLRSGRVHFIELVPYAEARELEDDPELYLTRYTPRNYYYVGWNPGREPFDSVEVRRALTLGIDRQAIIDNLFYGFGKVAASPLASNIWAHDAELRPLPYDPARATELLAAEGFADRDGDGILERDGKPFRLELMTNAENRLRQDIVVMLQSQLKRIGIDVVPRILEFNSMMAPLAGREFDGVVMGLGIGTDLDLTSNFHTLGMEQGFNWGGFSDPEVDRLIEQANEAETQAERRALFVQLQARLHELQPVTFLYEGERIGAARRELTGIEPNALSSFANMRTWRLEPVDRD